MSYILNFNAFSDGSCLASDLPPVQNITDVNLTDAKYTGLYVRQDTSNVDETPTNEGWSNYDTVMNAQFQNNLEAGNIDNKGLAITNVLVNRRFAGETTNLTIATLPFSNDSVVKFTDVTAPLGDFVYQIVPVAENNVHGQPNEVSATTDFYGWWIVDKDTGNTFPFYIYIDGTSTKRTLNTINSISTTLNQGKVVLETLNKYPQVYYTPVEYHTFTIQAGFSSDTESTFDQYQAFLNMITSHKPLLVKSGGGDYYIMDASSPSKQTIANQYKEYDFGIIQVSLTEIMDFNDYFNV